MHNVEHATQGSRSAGAVVKSGVRSLKARLQEYRRRLEQFQTNRASMNDKLARVEQLELQQEHDAIQEQARTLNRVVQLARPSA